MIGSVAVAAGFGAAPHLYDLAWSLAGAAGVLYALVMLVRGVCARRRAARWGAACGIGHPDWAVTQLRNVVNTTSDQPFAQVGATTRWPAVWIGPPVSPPAPGRPAAPAPRGQRRRLSRRSVLTMTHRRGPK